MFAGAKNLDNLVVIVDNNGLQIDGDIADVCSPYPIDKKFEAFNFHVINVADGNDFDQLKAAFDEAKTMKGMPTAIVMKTVKGKGVSFMENQASRYYPVGKKCIGAPKVGDGFELDAIASCYIGGAAASGGVGTIIGAVIGAFTMGILNNGMSLIGWTTDVQKVVKGQYC